MSLKKLVENLIAEIKQDELEVDESTTTGNIAGYNIPGAFSDGGDKDKKRKKKIATQLGMQIVGKLDENRWNELKKSEGTPRQKIGLGIRGINSQLSEMEQFIKWYGKIKHESGMKTEDQWKRTQNHLFEIRERLNRISKSISEL